MLLSSLVAAAALAATAPDATALPGAATAALPPPGPSVGDAHLPTQAPRLKLLGLQLDAGVPDGGTVSLLVRPVKWVRADAGFAYNYLGYGGRGGLTLVPFHWAVVPTLRAEVGRFFRSNVNAKVGRFANDLPSYAQPMLDAFGYDYASAQLGLEFGSQSTFVFFVRGGLAWLKADFGDGSHIRDSANPDTEVSVKGLSAKVSGPTASLGFLFYVW